MSRVIKAIKKYGIFGTGVIFFKYTIRRIFRKIVYYLREVIILILLPRNIKYLEKLFNNVDQIIIFENNFGWSKIMKQRPQQIAAHMPKNVLFLYHSDSDHFKTIYQIDKLKDNLQ